MNSAHGYTEGAEESDEFKLHNYRAMENRLLSANSDIKSLRDQLSKERREKEKLKELHIHQETHLNDQFEKERETIKGFVDSHAQLEIALFKEREMRKELMQTLQQYLFLFDEGGQTRQEIESLIAKATELDKNN